jgi:hypothetical protein
VGYQHIKTSGRFINLSKPHGFRNYQFWVNYTYLSSGYGFQLLKLGLLKKKIDKSAKDIV